MPIVKRSASDPTHGNDAGDIDVYEADIATDTAGDGSTTVNWDEPFATGSPKIVVTGDADGQFYVSARGASQCTVNVSGSSTTDGTVTVNVLAVGER